MGRYTDMLRKRLRNPLPPAAVASVERRVLKGQKDGNCNRTACQAPLRGRKQWRMKAVGFENLFHHYCDTCANLFNSYDRSQGKAPRCEVVPDRLRDEVEIVLAGEPS
ncbi:hypothetical protein [Methylorubrum extorquens]|uniref:hypothetical protein n=1 Tax=Methylorubrum extorquens TaxID=408 RepID=UPI00209D033F|nr:hypothetical protein [Methylorubrum extorquens]MCP1540107.1 hypothetical protein [Methylorubrum extorquens]